MVARISSGSEIRDFDRHLSLRRGSAAGGGVILEITNFQETECKHSYTSSDGFAATFSCRRRPPFVCFADISPVPVGITSRRRLLLHQPNFSDKSKFDYQFSQFINAGFATGLRFLISQSITFIFVESDI